MEALRALSLPWLRIKGCQAARPPLATDFRLPGCPPCPPHRPQRMHTLPRPSAERWSAACGPSSMETAWTRQLHVREGRAMVCYAWQPVSVLPGGRVTGRLEQSLAAQRGTSPTPCLPAAALPASCPRLWCRPDGAAWDIPCAKLRRIPPCLLLSFSCTVITDRPATCPRCLYRSNGAARHVPRAHPHHIPSTAGGRGSGGHGARAGGQSGEPGRTGGAGTR